METPLSTLNTWILVAMMTVVSFLPRAVFLFFAPNLQLPDSIKRSLRYVPAAVFPALIAPAVLMVDGQVVISPQNAQLVAAIAAGILAMRQYNTFIVVIVGMLVLHLARNFL